MRQGARAADRVAGAVTLHCWNGSRFARHVIQHAGMPPGLCSRIAHLQGAGLQPAMPSKTLGRAQNDACAAVAQMLSFEGCPHLKDNHLKALAPLSGSHLSAALLLPTRCMWMIDYTLRGLPSLAPAGRQRVNALLLLSHPMLGARGWVSALLWHPHLPHSVTWALCQTAASSSRFRHIRAAARCRSSAAPGCTCTHSKDVA